MANTKPNDSGTRRVEEGEQTAVAVLHAPRLPYSKIIQDEFGVDKNQWRSIVEAHYPNAQTLDSVVLVLSYCKARRLDVFKKPVHIVPMWSSALGKMVDTVWPGIAEMRTTAARTQEYAGKDAAVFGPIIEAKVFSGRATRGNDKSDKTATVTYPEWCQVTVYRLVKGTRCAFVGPKVYWLETFAEAAFGSGVPNAMWAKRSFGQIEKCAEAAALRVAFPEEIGSDYSADEMQGKDRDMIDVTPQSVSSITNAIKADDGPPASDAKPAAEVIDGEFTEAAEDAASARQREEEQPDDDIPDDKPKRIEPCEISTKEADGTTNIKIGVWVDNYIAAVETSTFSGDVLRWGDFNRSTLDFVRGRAASKENWKLIDDQMLRLMKALPDGADPKKAAEITAAAKAKDAAKKAEKISTGTKPTAEKAGTAKQNILPARDMTDSKMPLNAEEYGAAPVDPEEWIKWIDKVLATVTSPHDLENVWNTIVGPSFTGAFPPDQTEAIAIFDKHEKRLDID